LGKRLRLRSQPIAFSPDKTLVSSPIYLVRSSYRALDFSTAKIALGTGPKRQKRSAIAHRASFFGRQKEKDKKILFFKAICPATQV